MTSSLCFCSPSETWGSTLGPHLVESMVAVECGDRSRGITAQGSLGAQGPAAWSRASSLHGAWNLGERKGVKASSQGGNRDNKRPKGMNPGLSLDGAQVLVLCGQCHSQKMTCYDSICIRLSTLKKKLYIYIWRRKWQPTPVFLPRESHEQRSLTGYSPWGHKSWSRLGN